VRFRIAVDTTIMKNRTLPLLLAALAIVTAARGQTIYTPWAFTTFAGRAGGSGNADGLGTESRFNNPVGITVDAATNVYVADEFNDTIRKITRVGTNWVVTTLAGSARISGTNDSASSDARFSQPTGVAVDGAGNLYVADNSNYTLRKVTPDGIVTTLAGSAGFPGSKDGSNSVARFNRPSGVAVDFAGNNIYIADAGNKTIRQASHIGTNWAVTTIAGTANQTGNYDGTNGTIRFGVLVLGPQNLALDNAGNLIVADTGNSTIRKLTPVGTNWIASTLAGNGSIGTANGTNSGAQFYNPYGVVVDSAGNIYVADGDNVVRKMTPQGTNWVVTTIAGDTAFGSVDGTGTAAEFFGLMGIAVDGADNLFVTDTINNTIRMITPATVVTTIAGTVQHRGTNDGGGTTAQFYLPFGVATDLASNVYVGDQGNHLIRKIAPNGTVTTLAGNPDGGSQDGTNALAAFRQPSSLAVDAGGNIYVADSGNYKIRRVSPVGTNWVVTTLAGGSIGSTDGSNKVASFRNPYGLAMDAATNLYVADTMNHAIRRVSPVGTNWVVTTIAGNASFGAGIEDGTNKAAHFNSPYGLTVDNASNVYVADFNNMTIRKIRPVGTNWVTTTIAGLAGFFGTADGTNSDARFLYPEGITIDAAGNLYVSDGGNATIRRLSPVGTNWVVTTIGGANRPGGVGQAGSTPGIGAAARFNDTWGLTIGPDGDLYIADGGENTIVKGSPLFIFDTSATGFTNANSSFHLRVTGPPGSNVVVEASSNLVNWTAVQTNVMPPIGANLSLPGTNSAGIYRARLMP
jgi:sugar lactone lactonase YvrE